MEDKQYKYVYGIGKTALDIPESEIRYAMENTKSNAEAARFLKVSFTTYKKYARLYTDRDTGKTLYELHKNQFGVGTWSAGAAWPGRPRSTRRSTRPTAGRSCDSGRARAPSPPPGGRSCTFARPHP